MAERAWGDVERGRWPADLPEGDRSAYSHDEIRHWLEVFLGRFFANQFKRSALPNGPKISSGGSLSPRGDWRAPSDASAGVWLENLKGARHYRIELTEVRREIAGAGHAPGADSACAGVRAGIPTASSDRRP